MSLWHAADGDRRFDPMEEEALLEAFHRGRLSRRALVWREGMEAWAPLHQTFPDIRARQRGRIAWDAILAPVVFGGFLCALGLAIWVEYFGGLDVLTRHVDVGVYLAVAAGQASSALTAVPLAWFAARRVVGQELKAFLRTVIVFAGVAGAGLAAQQLPQARQVIDQSRAAEGMRDYRMTFDPGTGLLSLTGQIGPGYARMLDQRLQRHDVRGISITSTGGLIREAMTAARLLETRPEIAITARGVCLSACVIVIMGGEERLADYDMVLGFHAAVPIAASKSALSALVLRQDDEASDKYLISRGVPEKHVKEAARLGGDSMHLVPSLDLAQDGTLTGVVNSSGRRIPLWEARALLAAEYYDESE